MRSSRRLPSISASSRALGRSEPGFLPAPARILKRLGIKRLTTGEFRLRRRATLRHKKGVALFRYGKRAGGAYVILAEPDDSVLLGTFTLTA